jgi:hypothetical protein
MTTINLETIADNVPSMCIPRTFINITRNHVYKTINDLNLGVIDHIDMVRRKNEKGEDFQRVFIHFSKWYSNSVADRARTLLLSGKEVKVIYEDPWFWKISANRSSERALQKGAYNPKIAATTRNTNTNSSTPTASTPLSSSPARRTYAQMASAPRPPPTPTPVPRKNNDEFERGCIRESDTSEYWPRSPSTSPPPSPFA